MKNMYNKGEILHKELSYVIQGIFMDVRKIYGSGHKEIVYCDAVEEYLILECRKILV